MVFNFGVNMAGFYRDSHILYEKNHSVTMFSVNKKLSKYCSYKKKTIKTFVGLIKEPSNLQMWKCAALHSYLVINLCLSDSIIRLSVV